MFGFIRAAVEAGHLKGLHLPRRLQVELLDVAREERSDLSRTGHGVSDLGQACGTYT